MSQAETRTLIWDLEARRTGEDDEWTTGHRSGRRPRDAHIGALRGSSGQETHPDLGGDRGDGTARQSEGKFVEAGRRWAAAALALGLRPPTHARCSQRTPRVQQQLLTRLSPPRISI